MRAACFPCATNLGATFDVGIAHRVGLEVAKEAKTKSAHVLLGPTLNLVRSPLGGRNYETFSEDPVVLGNLSGAYVQGCESQGIAATPKHFVANDAENQRKKLSVEVDEQTLREIYLLPFQILFKRHEPMCLMTPYNKINGTYVADDPRLLNGVVRGEWGFKGLIMSDWLATYSTAACLNAGMDLEMPGPTIFRGDKLEKAVSAGEVTEKTITDSARRTLKLISNLGRFEDPKEYPEKEAVNPDRDEFIAAASADGMVLLKNDGGVLPLSPKASVAVIGHFGDKPSLGGGGSARVDALRAIAPLTGIKEAGYHTIYSEGIPVFGALPPALSEVLFPFGSREASPTPGWNGIMATKSAKTLPL